MESKKITKKEPKFSVSFEREERYFLTEMKRAIEKERRRESAIKEEIHSFTSGKQVVLRNYK